MPLRAFSVFAALLLSQAAHAIVVTTVAVDPADDERSAKRFQAALARNNVRNLQILEFREDDQALADGFVAFAKKFKATDAQKTVDVSAGFLMVKGPRYFRLVGIHPDGMTEDLFGFEDEKLRMVTIPRGENAGVGLKGDVVLPKGTHLLSAWVAFLESFGFVRVPLVKETNLGLQLRSKTDWQLVARKEGDAQPGAPLLQLRGSKGDGGACLEKDLQRFLKANKPVIIDASGVVDGRLFLTTRGFGISSGGEHGVTCGDPLESPNEPGLVRTLLMLPLPTAPADVPMATIISGR